MARRLITNLVATLRDGGSVAVDCPAVAARLQNRAGYESFDVDVRERDGIWTFTPYRPSVDPAHRQPEALYSSRAG